MPSDDAQIQAVLKAKKDRESSDNVTNQVTAEMKSSLIFQINWADLLQAGPTSISSMGACFAASSSPKAVLDLNPPQDGFKYLKFRSVKANLVECGNLGRFAFIEAQTGMGTIQQIGVVMNGKMVDLIQTIGDPQSAQKLLKPQLTTIQEGAQTCLDAVTAIDKKFEDWLLFTCELHAACVDKDQATQEAVTSSEVCVAAEQTRLDYQQSTTEQAKKASDLLEKQVSMAGDAFKEASEKFPTGWDIMGQQVVQDLAHCATTALNAAIPALVDALNPMRKLKAAGDVVGSFVHPKNTGEMQPGSEAAQPAPSAPPRPNPVPANSSDPAYSEILKVTTYLAAVNSILHGKDDDIDWDKATGDGTAAGAKSSIKFLGEMLDDHVKQFRDVATSAEPSQTLTNILETSQKIASEVAAEVAKVKDPHHDFPEKSSIIVQKWHSDFAEQYQKANTLAATARSLPGSAAGGMPMMADVELQTAKINAQTTQAQAVLESAKNRLTTTQQMLTTSQENYIKATDLLLQQQNKLTEIQANLIKLTASNLTLKEVRAILIESIRLIISLKQQITNLVCFFNALTVIIKVTTKAHFTPFLQTVQALVSDGSSDSDNFKVAGYTLTDLQRTNVYSAVVTIRSYFGVFADIAKMWIEISRDNIIPGMELCDRCLEFAGDDKAADKIKQTVQKLQEWSNKASTEVAQLAGKTQKDILSGMQKRIEGVKETTDQLEAPPEMTLKAITVGTDATKQAGANYIEDKKKQNSLMRFGHIDD